MDKTHLMTNRRYYSTSKNGYPIGYCTIFQKISSGWGYTCPSEKYKTKFPTEWKTKNHVPSRYPVIDKYIASFAH
jgi:hypothetical protein